VRIPIGTIKKENENYRIPNITATQIYSLYKIEINLAILDCKTGWPDEILKNQQKKIEKSAKISMT
jgi:hypothetical protein